MQFICSDPRHNTKKSYSMHLKFLSFILIMHIFINECIIINYIYFINIRNDSGPHFCYSWHKILIFSLELEFYQKQLVLSLIPTIKSSYARKMKKVSKFRNLFYIVPIWKTIYYYKKNVFLSDSTTGWPKVRFGTKCPSITSRWRVSAPADINFWHSPTRLPKFEFKIEGAIFSFGILIFKWKVMVCDK